MSRARTWRWRRMRRYGELSRGTERSSPRQFFPGCTIAMCGYDLREGHGKVGAVKLWPAGPQLVVGEGIETVLAAATRIPYEDAPLRPAGALGSGGPLGYLPVIPGVERLIILVDHDEVGITAALTCTERWTRAKRTVVRLMPDEAGADFNDLVLSE